MPKAKANLEEAVRVGAKHQVTIPHRISRALRLKKGDHMLMRLTGQRVEMVPVNMVPRDQLWFWTPEWQARDREVDDALAQGDFKQAASAEDLFKALRSR
jgi:bifunctional DNA-binding transcriptional regulator/antitoxin component of YhaV-PrlF toxin-antitoxin module